MARNHREYNWVARDWQRLNQKESVVPDTAGQTDAGAEKPAGRQASPAAAAHQPPPPDSDSADEDGEDAHSLALMPAGALAQERAPGAVPSGGGGGGRRQQASKRHRPRSLATPAKAMASADGDALELERPRLGRKIDLPRARPGEPPVVAGARPCKFS